MRLAAVEIKIKDQTVRGFEGASLTTDSTVCYGRGGRKKVRKIKFQGFEPEHDFGTINRNVEIRKRSWSAWKMMQIFWASVIYPEKIISSIKLEK